MNVYPFIEAEKAQQSNVKRACELLKAPGPPTTSTAPPARRPVSGRHRVGRADR